MTVKAQEAAAVFSWIIGVTTQTLSRQTYWKGGEEVKTGSQDFVKGLFHKLKFSNS